MAITEKWLNSELQFHTLEQHLGTAMAQARYKSISNLACEKIVLDVGCGIGYGSYQISEMAFAVISIDVSRDALCFAVKNYRRSNLHFVRADANHLPLSNSTLSLILAFEIIEHLKAPKQFLSECNRVLNCLSLCVFSTPNKLVTSPYWKKPLNPVHIMEFTPEQVLKVLLAYFTVIAFRGQFIQSKKSLYKNYLFGLIGKELTQLNLFPLKRVYRAFTLKSKGASTLDAEAFTVKEFDFRMSNMLIVCKKNATNDFSTRSPYGKDRKF